MNQKEINLAALRFIQMHIENAIDCIESDDDFPIEAFGANFIDKSAFPELLDQLGFDQESIDNAAAISAAIYSLLGYSGQLASYRAWAKERGLE